MKKLLAYYLNPTTDERKEVAIDDSLETFYDILDCSIVEMHMIQIGEGRYMVICDEEGSFKDDLRIAAYDASYSSGIFGSILIVRGCDFDGNLVSLKKKDIDRIEENIRLMSYGSRKKQNLNHVVMFSW